MRFRPYRRASQFAVFALMFGIPVLNLYEIYTVTGTFYAVNIGGLGIADPVAILQTIFASGQVAPPILASILFPAMLALILGRVWCGWMCPYHLISDGAVWLRGTIRRRVLRRTEPEKLVVAKPFSANLVRYGFLIGGIAVTAAVGIPLLNFVSAPGILSTEAMIFVKERTFSVEMLFIVTILALELCLFPRFWCRLFCPTGSFIALFRTPFTLTVQAAAKNPNSKCCANDACSEACPMGLAPFKEGSNLLCTNCARCVDACRSDGRGTLQFGGFQG